MANEGLVNENANWIWFVGLTVVNWGLYGILLHKGQAAMGDPVHGRYKAFLFVGVAYFLIAVLGPLILLWLSKSDWSFSGNGMAWATVAGSVGAIGAFSVLLAFGNGGTPAVVMSLVFAGAPIVNALVAITLSNSWGRVQPAFLVGIIMAAIGAWMVVRYKPAPQVPTSPPAEISQASTGS